MNRNDDANGAKRAVPRQSNALRPSYASVVIEGLPESLIPWLLRSPPLSPEPQPSDVPRMSATELRSTNWADPSSLEVPSRLRVTMHGLDRAVIVRWRDPRTDTTNSGGPRE